MNGQFVELEDPVQDGYEPTQEEIEEYAEWLGAELPEDNELLWIAKEAACAKIPEPWGFYRKKDGDSDPFYFNKVTHESTWDHPLDQHYRELFEKEKAKLKAKKAQGNKQPTTQKEEKKTTPKKEVKVEDNSFHDAFFDDSSESDSIPRITVSKTPKTEIPKAQPSPTTKTVTSNNTQVSTANKAAIDQENNNHTAELNRLKQKHQDEIDQENRAHQKKLNQIRDDNDAEIQREKRKLANQLDDTIRAERNKNEAELDRIRKENQKSLSDAQKAQLDKLKNSFEDQKESMEREFQREIENMNHDHQREIDSTKSRLRSEIEKLEKSQENEVASIKQKHQIEMKNIEQNHREEIKSIKSQNAAEIGKIKTTHSNELEKLKAKNKAEMESELAKLKEFNEKVKKKKQQIVSKSNSGKSIEQQKQQLTENYAKEVEALMRRQNTKKKQIMEQFKEEIRTLRATNARKIESLRRRMSDEDIDIKLQTLENDNQEEIRQIKERHRAIVEELKLKNTQEIEQLKEEERQLKNALDATKREYAAKKKRDLIRISDRYEDELENIKESYQMQKEQMHANYTHDMQVAYAQMESQVPTQQYKKPLTLANSFPISIYPSFDAQSTSSRMSSVSSRSMSFFSKKIFSQNESATFQPDMRSVSSYNTYGNFYIEPDQNAAKKTRNKLAKIDSQFDNECESMISSIKDTESQIAGINKNYRAFVIDQNRNLSQLSIEFQQQSSALTRTINSCMADLENSYRSAQTQLMILKQPVQVSMPSPVKKSTRASLMTQRRRRMMEESSILEGDSSILESSTERLLRIIKRNKERYE